MDESTFDLEDLPAVPRQLLDYWNRIRGDRAVPSRKDFDPTEIPWLLPHLIMVQVIRDEVDQRFRDFEFRVIGTYVEERMKERYEGRRLSQIEGKGPGSAIWDSYCKVKREKKPKFLSFDYIGPMENVKRSLEIFLPLSNNGSRVDYVLVGLSFS